MKNLLSYRMTTIILALLVFYPAYAIGREPTARELLIMNLVYARCYAYEGYLTKEKAVEVAINNLEKKEGISRHRILTLMKDEDLQEAIDNTIETFGGCKKITKSLEKEAKD